MFYIYSLYTIADAERAFRLLRAMIPGPDESDYVQRGQLPVFIPNYYRGAYYQYPHSAGKSSQLFNTGTVSWVYRCLVEGLFGLRGDREGLTINPMLPVAWQQAEVSREFRGAVFNIKIQRDANTSKVAVRVDANWLAEPKITQFNAGKTYAVDVLIPVV